MNRKPAFGFADAIKISEEKAEALAAFDCAVEGILDHLQGCDLGALWDKNDQCINQEGQPVADLVNKLVEVRNDLLGCELDSSLTVESLARKDAKAPRYRHRYLHSAVQSTLCNGCEDIGAGKLPTNEDWF